MSTPLYDDDFELSPVTPISLQKFFAQSETERSRAQGCSIPTRQASDASSMTAREPMSKFNRRILWSALIPGFLALCITLGLASALVTWLFATKIAVSRRCAPEIHNQSPLCPGNNDQVLFTTVPVNIILTVSKIVDSAQSACASVIMLLAAFRISQSWQSGRKAGSISLPEFSELVALCTSGRLWALCNALSLSWRRRKGKNSRLLLNAIAVSLFAQLLSHTISFVDIYLHEATTTSVTSAGTMKSISALLHYGRQVNTSCSDPVVNGVRLTSPCSIGSSVEGQYLRYPNQAYAIFANVSETERIAQTFNQSIENLAITVDARLSGTENFNATTVGMSGQCRVATNECKMQIIPHGTSGYNCSSVGLPENVATTSSYNLGATGIHNRAVDVYKSPNSTDLTAGMPTDSTVQQRFLVPLQVPSVGNEPDDGFVTAGNLGATASFPEIMLYCSIVAHSVTYQYLAGNITVLDHSFLSKNESEVLLSPIVIAQVADTISQTNSDALAGNSTLYANAFARQLAANSLAYGSGNTLTSLPLKSEGYILGSQLTTSIPLRALLPFVVLIYIYGSYILFLLIGALTCSPEALNRTRNIHTSARPKDTAESPEDLANVVRLGQLRLTNPAFLIHQLLGTSTGRSMETFDSNIWSQQEKLETVKFTSELLGGREERGVGVHV